MCMLIKGLCQCPGNQGVPQSPPQLCLDNSHGSQASWDSLLSVSALLLLLLQPLVFIALSSLSFTVLDGMPLLSEGC